MSTIFITNCFIIFLIFILQYSGLAPLTLAGMTAMLVVPSVVFCSMYMNEFGAAMLGLLFGVCLDAVSVRAVCFNALVLMAIGCAASITAKNLFNRNVFTALILSFACTALFFMLKWVVFTAFTLEGAGLLLVRHTLPSILYTSVISFPLYFLFARILRVSHAEVKRG